MGQMTSGPTVSCSPLTSQVSPTYKTTCPGWQCSKYLHTRQVTPSELLFSAHTVSAGDDEPTDSQLQVIPCNRKSSYMLSPASITLPIPYAYALAGALSSVSIQFLLKGISVQMASSPPVPTRATGQSS